MTPRTAPLHRALRPSLALLVALAGGCDAPGEAGRGGAREGEGSAHRAAAAAAEFSAGPVVMTEDGPVQVVHTSQGGRFVVLQRGDGSLEVRDGLGAAERPTLRDPAAHMADPQGADGRRGEWWPQAQPFVTVRFPGPGDRRGARARASVAVGGAGASAQIGGEARAPAAGVAEVARRVDALEARLAALEGELAALWAGPGSAAERRARLFARWDECEEAGAATIDAGEGAAALDALRGHAGEQARRTIEAFIRANAPRGGADGFADDEVRALNERRASRQAFAPYGGE